MSPFEPLIFEAPFRDLGQELWDEVSPAQLTGLRLRWRSPDLLARLGLDPELSEEALIRAFGVLEPLPGRAHPPLAQRYIGYQFRVFNPHLGDGRGFLLAQLRGVDGALWDLGTKGSGTTPWSRGGDGRLTLKGGVREIIAAEHLHAMGVKTSRPLTVIEHRQELWRGDEPSPTRASVMVRMGESHVRFGTFERIYYLERDPEEKARLIRALVDHAVELYYPALIPLSGAERAAALYDAVAHRLAALVAGWMSAGFCHGVLNTDNMNIAGDSFDYGPFAFMEDYDPAFTAAYFDHHGLYAFERQADACAWNLGMLARPFAVVAPEDALRPTFDGFGGRVLAALRRRLLPRMGLPGDDSVASRALLDATLTLLRAQGPSYHGFFRALGDRLACQGIEEGGPRLPAHLWAKAGEEGSAEVVAWRRAWQDRWLEARAAGETLEGAVARARASNPIHVPYRREIERVWAAIDQRDDWDPFYALMDQLRAPFQG